MLIDKLAYPGDGAAALRDEAGRELPYVLHLFPFIKYRIYTGLLCPVDQARRVREEDLVRPNLDQ
jgi:hypothetical protein